MLAETTLKTEVVLLDRAFVVTEEVKEWAVTALEAAMPAESTGAGRLAGATVAVDVVVEGPTEAKAVAMATEEPGKTRHSPT